MFISGVRGDERRPAVQRGTAAWTLPKAAANVGPNGIDHCVVLEYSAFGVTGIGDDQTVITWGIERKKSTQDVAVTNIGQALGC